MTTGVGRGGVNTRYRIVWMEARRVLLPACPALPRHACLFPFGPLSALRYDHVVYTPRTANHFSVCLSQALPPWTPGKEAAGTESSSELGRVGAPAPLLVRHTFTHCTHCTCPMYFRRRRAEMIRRIDAEPTVVNDKKSNSPLDRTAMRRRRPS